MHDIVMETFLKKERKLNYLGKSWEIPSKPWRKVHTDIIIKSKK